MAVEDAVVSRIEGLINDAATLVVENLSDQAKSEEQRRRCSGWLASALNVIEFVCVDPDNAYRRRANDAASGNVPWMAPTRVGEVRSILERFLVDLKAGLLSSAANQARAEVLDDFLDQGEFYFRDGRKVEAGVVAGVVFEDTLRRICRKRQVAEKDVGLDQLISTLANSAVLIRS